MSQNAKESKYPWTKYCHQNAAVQNTASHNTSDKIAGSKNQRVKIPKTQNTKGSKYQRVKIPKGQNTKVQNTKNPLSKDCVQNAS